MEAILNASDVSALDKRQLLLDAAYFVDHAMIYPIISHKDRVNDSYVKFLSAEILRSIVADPEYLSDKAVTVESGFRKKSL